MEFLKHKWGYILLGVAVAAAVAAACFLLFWNDQGDAYTDGLLVRYEDTEGNDFCVHKEICCHE